MVWMPVGSWDSCLQGRPASHLQRRESCAKRTSKGFCKPGQRTSLRAVWDCCTHVWGFQGGIGANKCLAINHLSSSYYRIKGRKSCQWRFAFNWNCFWKRSHRTHAKVQHNGAEKRIEGEISEGWCHIVPSDFFLKAGDLLHDVNLNLLLKMKTKQEIQKSKQSWPSCHIWEHTSNKRGSWFGTVLLKRMNEES